MSNYKRVFLNNHYYFLTILINNRKLSLLTDYIDNLKIAFKKTKDQYPYITHSIVVLPDHFHMIICPKSAKHYPLIVSSIKKTFTNLLDNKIKVTLKKNLSESKIKKRESGVWHRRFYEHTIIDQQELNDITDYIHFNPVKHGYVNRAIDWRYSSFKKFARNRMYDRNWCDFSELIDYD
jgi:putative transposase